MEGLERLEKETSEMNNCSITAIFEYLKTRKDLYEKFKNKEKTMEGMYSYLYKKSEPMKQRNVAIVPDNLVYIWAVNYFYKSNEELGIKETKVKKDMPTSDNKTTEKADKEKEKTKSETQIGKNNDQLSIFQEVQK